MSSSADIAAHQSNVTIRYIERFPAHPPRKGDPAYKYFNACKRRLKKLGLMKCAIDSDSHYGQMEVHHSKVEFSHIPDVDIDKFNRLYGLHLDDAGFTKYIEEEGNAEVLCTEHHRGTTGVHSLPSPEWLAMRVAKNNDPIVIVQSNNLIPLTKEII